MSLATFLELFLVEERYSFDRERAVTSVLELAEYEGDPDVVYQASEYRDDGLNTFDAFHAALSRGTILSSDNAFNEVGVDRVPLEPPEDTDGSSS